MADKNRFDVNYQTKLLSCLLKDEAFFIKIYSLLNESFFETDAHRWVFKFLKEYYFEYKGLPTSDTLKQANDIFHPQILNGRENLLNQGVLLTVKQVEQYDVDEWIKKTIQDFCTEQILKDTIGKCIDHIENGNYNDVKLEIDRAYLNINEAEEIAYNYFDQTNIHNRLLRENVDRTSTGWELMDQYTKGGLAAGELGVVMAPTGVGKTFFVVNTSYGVLLQKKNVLYISLEMNSEEISNRMDAILSETSLNDLYDNIENVEERINKRKENLGQFYIYYHKRNRASITDIKLKIIQMKTMLNLDTVIVDYADIIKPEKGSNQKRWDLEDIYNELVGIAKEFNVKMWTCSQSNRSGVSADVLTFEHMHESYAKAFPTTLFITFTRSPEEEKTGRGRFYIVKNRLGFKYVMFEVHFRNEMSRIHVERVMEQVEETNMSNDYNKKKMDTAVDNVLSKIKNKKW